jgi:acetyl esterase/lipase
MENNESGALTPFKAPRRPLDVISREYILEPGWYLAGASPRAPLAAPVHADLAGLPPLLVQVGCAEIIRSAKVYTIHPMRSKNDLIREHPVYRAALRHNQTAERTPSPELAWGSCRGLTFSK